MEGSEFVKGSQAAQESRALDEFLPFKKLSWDQRLALLVKARPFSERLWL